MSARDLEKSSATNVNLRTRQSLSTSDCSAQRPPFIHSIFLVLVPNVDPRLICDASFPALDSIVHRGVTTAVMLTNATRELANYPKGVALYMNAVSDDTVQFNAFAVHSYDTDYVYKLLKKPTLSEIRGVHFIQAPDLSTADRVVGDLTATLAPLLSADRQAAAAAVGFLLTGEGDWSQLVKIPMLFGSGLVKIPRQSYEIGVDRTPSLGGLMCLAGKGIVRQDSRERLAQCQGPGDGCLRLDQIVFEMLSKTDLVLKFGA